MTDPIREKRQAGPLNPALKSTTETVYDTEHSSPPPIDPTSAQEGEGEGCNGFVGDLVRGGLGG